ncbi:MAG: reverse transcriptase domain-containing protein [Patescibacteria group bacterium]
MDNLFSAWKEFKKGKTNKPDVQEFEFSLEDNLFQIHKELKSKEYEHGKYASFYIKDPKLRHIHKATVKDRIIHHSIFRVLCPIFDKGFIYDSYSCRVGKGTHIAVDRLEDFIRKLSQNNSKTVYALKCDIKKFFDSVDKAILLKIIKEKIKDQDAIWLVSKILDSFSKSLDKGLPLGNVTSQLVANIYLNELDQHIKHNLKVKYYIRYCDDFIILGDEPSCLLELVYKIGEFLDERLCLKLHEHKVILRKHRQGIDFLGYVLLPCHRAIRTKTKRRMARKIIERRNGFDGGLVTEDSFKQSLNSYLGMIKHCNGYDLENEMIWLSGLAEIEI